MSAADSKATLNPRAVLQEVLDLVNRLPQGGSPALVRAVVRAMTRVSEVLEQVGKLVGVSVVGVREQGYGVRWNVETLQAVRQTLDDLLEGKSRHFHLRGVTVIREATPRPWVRYQYRADLRTAFLLGLLRLLDVVGVDRLRRCPYEDPKTHQQCGRLFVARKRQLACTLDHAQGIQYQRWVQRGGLRDRKQTRRRS